MVPRVNQQNPVHCGPQNSKTQPGFLDSQQLSRAAHLDVANTSIVMISKDLKHGGVMQMFWITPTHDFFGVEQNRKNFPTSIMKRWFFGVKSFSYEGEGVNRIQCQIDCSVPMVVNDKRVFAHFVTYFLCWRSAVSDNKQCQSHDLLEDETMRPCHVHQHFHIFSKSTFFVRRFRQKRSELKTPLAWGIRVHLKTTRPFRDEKQSCNNFFLDILNLT